MTAPTVNVTVKLTSLGGEALEGVRVMATLDKVDIDATTGFVAVVRTQATTDSTGTAVLALFPNALTTAESPGLGTTGSVYTVTAQIPGGRAISVDAVIPNEACNLHDCLVNVDEVYNPTLSLSGAVRYDRAQTLSTDQKTQARSNLGFDAAVRATVLTGLSLATATAVDASDSILAAIGKLQAGKAALASPALTGTPTAPTANAGTNTTQIATTAFVRTEVANLVAASPAVLDTLNEIAAALNNDPSFANTMATQLALKAPLASPTFTGTVTGTFSGNLTGNVTGSISGGTVAGSTGMFSSHVDSAGQFRAQVSSSTKIRMYASGTDGYIDNSGNGGAMHIRTADASHLYFGANGGDQLDLSASTFAITPAVTMAAGASISKTNALSASASVLNLQGANSGTVPMLSLYNGSGSERTRLTYRVDTLTFGIAVGSGDLSTPHHTFTENSASFTGTLSARSASENVANLLTLDTFNTGRGLEIGTGADGAVNDVFAIYNAKLAGYGGHKWKVGGSTRMTLTEPANLTLAGNSAGLTVNYTTTGAFGIVAVQRSGVAKGYLALDASDNFGLMDSGGTMRVTATTGGVGITGNSATTGTAAIGSATNITGATLHVEGNITLNTEGVETEKQLYFRYANAGDGGKVNSDGPLTLWEHSTKLVTLNGGAMLVGTTSSIDNGRLEVLSSGRALNLKTTGGAAATPLMVWNDATSGDNNFVIFATEGSGSITSRGTIAYNRGGGVVAYNTTSDYRAKQVLGDITNSGELIDAMRPYRARMHGATMDIAAFVAHELQAVVPWAVTGEKDGEAMQQVNLPALTPLMVAELQSLRARVAELEARIH